MIDERQCYELIGFYSSKSSCIATVIRSILSNHRTEQQNPTSKNQIFWKQTTTLARFLRWAHVLLGLQPCLVDNRRSWRNAVSQVEGTLTSAWHVRREHVTQMHAWRAQVQRTLTSPPTNTVSDILLYHPSLLHMLNVQKKRHMNKYHMIKVSLFHLQEDVTTNLIMRSIQHACKPKEREQFRIASNMCTNPKNVSSSVASNMFASPKNVIIHPTPTPPNPWKWGKPPPSIQHDAFPLSLEFVAWERPVAILPNPTAETV